MDEVGRGAWAGPLVVGAVALKEQVAGLKDSKLLTRPQRNALDLTIRTNAYIGLGWAAPTEIDTFGLTTALRLAYGRALSELQSSVEIGEIIIDGNYNFLHLDTRARTLIHADALVPAVSAASIVAKVARDNYMINLINDVPHYGFEHHVGYGTLEHRQALEQFGATFVHRHSFRPVKRYVI